jgi:GNAT superfamily N-acetyltransferase
MVPRQAPIIVMIQQKVTVYGPASHAGSRSGWIGGVGTGRAATGGGFFTALKVQAARSTAAISAKVFIVSYLLSHTTSDRAAHDAGPMSLLCAPLAPSFCRLELVAQLVPDEPQLGLNLADMSIEPLPRSFLEREHVHDLHVAARPDFFRIAAPDEVAAWFVTLVEGPTARVWLAEEADGPIGYVLAYFRERGAVPFSYARRWCEIDQIAVDPRWRRRGTARALIEAAVDEAGRCGIRDIEPSSWAFNLDAHETFRRIGLRPKLVRFELYL